MQGRNIGYDQVVRAENHNVKYRYGGYSMEDIIKRIQDGDKNAYTELYEKTKRMVMYNIRLKGVSPDDEEDVAQETYKKVFEKIDTLEKPEDACLWIRSIAANTAVDHMRRSGKIQTVSMDEITGPEEAEISEEILLPEDAVEREMALKELGDILRALPADSYKLLAARYYNKEDYKMIEAELGISAATARKRVQRILGDMRETICARRKKGTTVLAATAAAPVLSMFFAEDAEAAVVPAGLSAKVAAVAIEVEPPCAVRELFVDCPRPIESEVGIEGIVPPIARRRQKEAVAV